MRWKIIGFFVILKNKEAPGEFALFYCKALRKRWSTQEVGKKPFE